MSGTDGNTKDASWPMPKFRFSVDWGSVQQNIPFQEVSGLDTEAETIEYRVGGNPEFSTVKMPGMTKSSCVTLKRGVFVKSDSFWEWYNEITMNTIKRRQVVIKLLDDNGKPTMTWTLQNAWPTKITGTDLKSDSNEIAVDSIEIAHEGLTIAS